MVYLPREDSELLAQVVKEHAYGIVLDVGTGSGIQAQTAQQCEGVTQVDAVDINPKAVQHAKNNGVNAIQSDMFENVTQTYDTITSNTPYLPDEPLAPDVALDGGPKGFEWTKTFLQRAKNHLKPSGQILFLISTLTNQHVIEETLLKQAYTYEIVARKKLSFEELLVYKAHYALQKRPNAVYLAHGRRSVVYLDRTTAIKCTEKRRIQQEARMLQIVNKHNIGPAYQSHTDTQLCMQYIEGVRIDHFLQTATTKEITAVIKQVQEQLSTLDKLGINKKELKNPYKHIIVTPTGPVLIDWERAAYTTRTQNIAQFNEYLKRNGYEKLI